MTNERTGRRILCIACALLWLLALGDANAQFTFDTPTLVPNINSSSGDWGPSITADGLQLFFISQRPGGQGERDIWVASRPTTSDLFGEPVNLGRTVNGVQKENQPSISDDGRQLFFFSDRDGSDDLYVTTRTDPNDVFGFGEPVSLGPVVNDGNFHDGYPSISSDGLSLYFHSLRPGDKGPGSIWVTRRTDPNDPLGFGPPEHLAVVNSEIAYDPEISSDGLALFFSSDRIDGLPAHGSGTFDFFDLWVATRDSTEEDFGEPINLETLNSNFGDFNPGLSVAEDILYFSSSRPGSDGEDIWQARIIRRPPTGSLRAGDADMDLDFDQLDLVQVQIAAKYLTGQAATWGEGDWDGAPGGEPGSPPAGDGFFNQLDIVTALAPGHYLTGPYGALVGSGQAHDGQTSIVYHAGTGNIQVDAPAGQELTSINIDSAVGVFTADAAQNLGGSFDNDADNNIFKATFGSSFGSLSFGNVAQAGLSEEFLLGDLTVVGSLAGGGDLGNVDLVYVAEPASALLLSVGLAIGVCVSTTRYRNPQ